MKGTLPCIGLRSTDPRVRGEFLGWKTRMPGKVLRILSAGHVPTSRWRGQKGRRIEQCRKGVLSQAGQILEEFPGWSLWRDIRGGSLGRCLMISGWIVILYLVIHSNIE